MKKETLFELLSPYRSSFKIQGFRFGSGEPSVAIVGAIRGDEFQQQFICSQIVKNLIQIEEAGLIESGHEILVIPCVNHYSINIGKRFWAMDNTDINRMFPGYDKGETTQRIAAALFNLVRDYKYGIQLASFYLHGDFIPHVRILTTGYEDVESARTFALPYILLRTPSSFDTTLLHYNWQIFGTKAFSIYSGETASVNKESAKLTWNSILRFLSKNNFIHYKLHNGYDSCLIQEKELTTITSGAAGFLYKINKASDFVRKGDLIAKILDPYDGSVVNKIYSPVSGEIFFSYQSPLISADTTVYKIAEYT
ncbi:MAG: succinylglutamate desuccinylase/aspartoacylase family protein [Spirochaetaceae bacterium]|nr:succinylglutamate desuccinylase/aspartoacylase family protein [Spirochaetaceae bacterium]